MTRYSNNPTLLDDLRNSRETVLALDEDDEPELGGERWANGRRWPVANRLAAEDLQAVVDGYRAGRTARELAERFEISTSSVKRVVRRAGAGDAARLWSDLPLQSAEPLTSTALVRAGPVALATRSPDR